MWMLVLILHFGMPNEQHVIVAHRLDRKACLMQSINLIRRSPDQTAVRCEPDQVGI